MLPLAPLNEVELTIPVGELFALIGVADIHLDAVFGHVLLAQGIPHLFKLGGDHFI